MKAINRVWARARTIRLAQFVSDSVSSYMRTNCSLMAAGVATFISANALNVEESGLQRQLPAALSALLPTVVTPFITWLTGIVFLSLLYRWLIPGRVRWREALAGAVMASSWAGCSTTRLSPRVTFTT